MSLFTFLFTAALFLGVLFPQRAHAAFEYSPTESWQRIQPEFFSDQGQKTLAFGVMSAAFAFSLDQDAREHFGGTDRLGGWEWLGDDFLGTGVPGFLLGASFWIAGDLQQNASLSNSGQAQIESIFLTSLATSLVKGIGSRKRPDGSDYYSFPSGHTSTVFASATVLNEFYGWGIGLPAYLLAAFTGAARVSSDRHWLSDTVGGAALGIWIAQAVSRARLKKEESATARNHLELAPLLKSDRTQIFLRYSF